MLLYETFAITIHGNIYKKAIQKWMNHVLYQIFNITLRKF